MLSVVFASLGSEIPAVLIGALVSAGVTLITLLTTPLLRWAVDRDLHRRQADYAEELEKLRSEHSLALERAKADIEYEMNQRKSLRAHVGAFRGRLIEVGNSLNFRLDNVRENRTDLMGDESSENWLDVGGEYRREHEEGYYFVSTVYRFMAFAAVGNRFERAAIYVDPRYAEPTDEQVVFYVRALRWVLTDPKLFAGVEPPYRQQHPTDHFYTDDIRRMCAEMTRDDGELKEMDEVQLDADGPLRPVLRFFDGLRYGSLKWDRLMAFDLVLKAFLNVIGYEQVKSTQEWFDMTAASIRRREIRRNLVEWLPRLAITGEPAQCIRTAVERAGTTAAATTPADPAADAAEPQA